MSIYSTPLPPGSPDFTTPTLRAGQLLANVSGSTSGSVTLGPYYCGNVSAVAVSIGFTATALHGFTVAPTWYADAAGTHTIWQTDQYQGLCQAQCIVADTLPVLGPYLALVVTATGGTITYSGSLMTTLATSHRLVSVPYNGLCISFNSSVAASSSHTQNANYLSPGLYAYNMSTSTTVTSVQISLGLYNAAGTQLAIIAFINNPTANTLYQGLCMIGEYMPVFLVNNNNTTTAVTPFLSLVGPQM